MHLTAMEIFTTACSYISQTVEDSEDIIGFAPAWLNVLLAECLETENTLRRMVPMFITTLSQTRMKSRFLAADKYISPKKSNSVGASWLKPSRKIAHLRLSSPPYIMEAQRRQAR